MVLRQLFQIGAKVGVGSGVAAGVLLGWASASQSMAQTAPPREFTKPFSDIEQTALPPGPVAMKASVTSSTLTQRNCLNKHHIQLPIRLDESARALIQAIHLYSKESASAPWVLREKAGTMDAAFRTKVDRDGEYWFAIVTVDKHGRSFPSNLATEPPGLIVIVDTELPRIELRNLGVTPAGQLVLCNVTDANPDNGSVRLSFQGGDKIFRSLEPISVQPSIFCIPTQAVFTGLIRVTASDLAGNQTLSETHLNQLALTEPTVPKAPMKPPVTVENPLPGPLPMGVSGGAEAVEIREGPLLGSKAITLSPLPDTKLAQPLPLLPADDPMSPRRLNRKTPTVSETGSPSPADASAPERFPDSQVVQQANYREPAKCQHVKAAKIFLDYQVENVGQSGVGKIEVWLTPDQGKTWQKLAEEAKRMVPLEVNLPGEGLFGITLVTANGRGVLGKSPGAGDTPDAWVHVDTTRPIAQIVDTKVKVENKQTTVTIQWTSMDANLPELPVNVFYAATPQGPWLPITKGLPAEGEMRWSPPAEFGIQAYIQVETRDRAGNVGIAVTTVPVQFDDSSRPRAVIRTITTETVSTPMITNGPALSPTPAPIVVIPSSRARW